MAPLLSQTMPSGVAPAATAPRNLAAIREAGEQFEAVFLGQMLAHMFAGVGDDPLLGGGATGRVYRSLMHEEYGKVVARSGGLGIEALRARAVRHGPSPERRIA